jgi:hypothetical protein
MSSSATMPNGKQQRKSLAEQLDRLDGIIDALDVGLQGAVADAVKDAVALAVQQAVEAVLREVLARPDLLRAVAAQAAPVAQVAVPEPATGTREGKASSAWSRAVKSLAATLAWLGAAANRVGRGVATVAGLAANALARGLRRAYNGAAALASVAWRRRRLLGLPLTVGLAVGVGGYLAGPVISSAALGLAGAAGSAACSALAPVLRLLRGVQPPAAGA